MYQVMKDFAAVDPADHTQPAPTPGGPDIPIKSSDPSFPDGDEECPICMEREAEVIFPCAHSFCNQCAEQW